MDKQLQKAQEMCEQLRKEASQAKSDASLEQARAEGAEKQLQQAEQDLKVANAKQHHLQDAQEKCEKLQKDLLHATNNVNLLKARAEVAEKQLQQAEHDSIASEQDALCGALAEQERLKTVIRGLEGALDTANQQIAHTTKQLQAANDLSAQAMQKEEIWKGRAESAEKMLLQAEQDLRVSTERQQRAVETLERLRSTIRLGSLRALKLAG
jgi:predicted  nucleic acid-binding Zn-ribbon protein